MQSLPSMAEKEEILSAPNQPPQLPRTGKVFVCIDAAEKGSRRGWGLNYQGVNLSRDPPHAHSSCRIAPASSISMFRALTFKGGGQGGGWVPGADPADGQVALHATPLVQHAGVHGRAWGRRWAALPISWPWQSVAGTRETYPHRYVSCHCLEMP